MKKIRCDRRGPECSNCVKAKVPCGYSNRSKRSNQTKQLYVPLAGFESKQKSADLVYFRAEDLAGFGTRLDTIYGATSELTQRMDTLTRLVATPYRPSPVPDDGPQSRISEGCYLRYSQTDDPSGCSSPARDSLSTAIPHVIVDMNGDVLYYGACSTVSLFANARSLVKTLVIQNQDRHSKLSSPSSSAQQSSPGQQDLYPAFTPAVTAVIQQKYNEYQLPLPHRTEPEGDGKPLELPPQMFLESSLNVYFEDTSLDAPIFYKETLLEAMHTLYAPNTSYLDNAWVLCFNNIILQSLSSKSKLSRKNPMLMGHMTDSLLTSLIMNAKRALQNVEMFFHPRSVNVQALLSLVSFLSLEVVKNQSI